jgi:hypothetical protein
MAVNNVNLYVSQILEDLDNGLSWLKSNDLGYGSVQEKYNAKDQQIAMIRKHPNLKDAEPSLTIFTVIDDTKVESHSDQVVEIINKEVELKPITPTTAYIAPTGNPIAVAATEELNAFANL